QGRDYIRERCVSQPGRAVVGGLARIHPVTRNGRVTYLAVVRRLALVVPHGEEAPIRCDRDIGLPLSACSGIGIQLDWRGKGYPAVGGADVEDVGGVGAGAVAGIDVANYAV